MKKILLVSTFVLMLPLQAHAATLLFPSEAPIASITIPDAWEPKETDAGVDATSEDGAVYFSADIANLESIEKVTSDAVDFLQENGVTIDGKSAKETPVEEINGLKMTTIDWDGKDKDGPVSIGLAFIQLSDTKALVATYWGSKTDEDKHSDDVVKILASIKPAK